MKLVVLVQSDVMPASKYHNYIKLTNLWWPSMMSFITPPLLYVRCFKKLTRWARIADLKVLFILRFYQALVYTSKSRGLSKEMKTEPFFIMWQPVNQFIMTCSFSLQILSLFPSVALYKPRGLSPQNLLFKLLMFDILQSVVFPAP